MRRPESQLYFMLAFSFNLGVSKTFINLRIRMRYVCQWYNVEAASGTARSRHDQRGGVSNAMRPYCTQHRRHKQVRASISPLQLTIHRGQFDDSDHTSIRVSDILRPDLILLTSMPAGTISVHPRSHTAPTAGPKRILLADRLVIFSVFVVPPRAEARQWRGRAVDGCERVGVRVRAPGALRVPPGPSHGRPILLVVGRVQMGLREDVAELCEFLIGHRHAASDAWVLSLVRQYIVVR